MRPVVVRDDGTGYFRRLHTVPSECGKQAYTSRKRAATAAKASTRISGEFIEPYHCWSPCHAWHIGHPPAPYDPAIARAPRRERQAS